MKDYKRLTIRHEDGSHSFMYDYNATTPPIKTLLDRLAELEDKIENGMLIFIDEPFYSECDDCWAVFQRKNDNVITCQMTERQARNYKKFKGIENEPL